MSFKVSRLYSRATFSKEHKNLVEVQASVCKAKEELRKSEESSSVYIAPALKIR